MGGIFDHLQESRRAVERLSPLLQGSDVSLAPGVCLLDEIDAIAGNCFDALIHNRQSPGGPAHPHSKFVSTKLMEARRAYSGIFGMGGIHHSWVIAVQLRQDALRNVTTRVELGVGVGNAFACARIIDGWTRAILIEDGARAGMLVEQFFS